MQINSLSASRLSKKILGSLFVRIFVFLILVLFILLLLLLQNVLNVCFKDIIRYRRSLTLSLNFFNHSIVKQIHSLFPYRRFENRSLEWLAVMLFYNRLLAMRDLQLTTLIAGLPRARSARGTEPHTHRLRSTSFRLVVT